MRITEASAPYQLYFNSIIWFLLHLFNPSSSHSFRSIPQARRDGASGLGPLLARPGSHMDAGSNPGSPASHPAPRLWPREGSGGRPKALGPCTHVGDLEESPGFGLA